MLTFDFIITDDFFLTYIVVESAPKRFLVETVGESNGEKQDLDENADPAHAAASSKVRGWMDRMKKQKNKNRIFDQFRPNFNNGPYKIVGSVFGTCCACGPVRWGHPEVAKRDC